MSEIIDKEATEVLPKQEAPKQEPPKQQPPKQQPPKQELSKQEAPKQESPKPEPPKKAAPKMPVAEIDKKEEAVAAQAPIKKKSKAPIIAVIVAVAAVLAIAGIFFFRWFNNSKKLKDQIALGDKYMTDLDYENAILAYEKALEMDPNNEEAYVKLGDLYLKMAADSESIEELDVALQYLGTGKNTMEKGLVIVKKKDRIKQRRDKMVSEAERIRELIQKLADEEAERQALEEAKRQEELERARREEEERKKKAEEEKKKEEDEDKDKNKDKDKDKKDDKKTEKTSEKTSQKTSEKTSEETSEEKTEEVESYEWGGKIADKQVSYRVEGRNVHVMADLSSVLWNVDKQRDVFDTTRVRDNAPAEVFLGSVDFTDGGGMTYTAGYDMFPHYDTSDSGEKTVTYSKSGFKGYIHANGHFLLEAKCERDGNFIHWRFTLPDGYNMNKNFRITEMNVNENFYYDMY